MPALASRTVIVDPEEEGVKPLPEDLHVSVTYRKNGRIEISW